MDGKGVKALEDYVRTHDPIFKHANSDYYNFCNIYAFVNSSMHRKDALKAAQEKWIIIKNKGTRSISCKIMDATYTTGYAKMQKQKAKPVSAPTGIKPKKMQKSMNDFFGKKVNCCVYNVLTVVDDSLTLK